MREKERGIIQITSALLREGGEKGGERREGPKLPEGIKKSSVIIIIF